MKKPIGTRGSWFATWGDKSYPVLHNTWWTHPHDYRDPMVGARQCGKKYLEYRDVLLSGDSVIIQRDKSANDLSRAGYIGLFKVENAMAHADGSLSLRVLQRLVSF